MSTTKQRARREEVLRQIRIEEERRVTRRRLLGLCVSLALVAIVALGLWQGRPTATEATGDAAPVFTLPSTSGRSVSLADYRGSPVLIYFNEGAGCGSCTQQMAEIEKSGLLSDAGIVVLPVVMNTAAQIQPDLDRFGVTTPYLLDDGTVSQAYGALGTGMHAGLPGHGFVLVDEQGAQLWHGEYPSMWLAPEDLLREVTSRL